MTEKDWQSAKNKNAPPKKGGAYYSYDDCLFLIGATRAAGAFIMAFVFAGYPEFTAWAKTVGCASVHVTPSFVYFLTQVYQGDFNKSSDFDKLNK
ncbi:MAG: hypothetical protein P4N41_25910 [Negativicutes bacterium]|nr:hypothetical protein [Negativicutes bacterium]